MSRSDSGSGSEQTSGEGDNSGPAQPPSAAAAAETQRAARRAEREAAKQAAKAQQRARRAGEDDGSWGRKPCTLCGRACDLLVRCRVDAGGAWQMACGRCWKAASGGRVDGDGSEAARHYAYGGLWKNTHAALSGRGKCPKTASGVRQRPEGQEQRRQPGDAAPPEQQQQGEGQRRRGAQRQQGRQQGRPPELQELLLAAAADCDG
ncbi:hypothetical protein Rsub_04039 [Raphidocelis subcapitata]|uniref:Uncharacterized protein n=1 Tax=Raphidocelis subcapitata TaxID=307507 RepID=A0A2V0P3S5_9CHLO|nr:hypothetical protein Rsub_04039 [Raphidocelis subcapitata]|eukprot:GBF91735.1 hypothetical protein Rsub_04039 [Raphidocelis subcapitata]